MQVREVRDFSKRGDALPVPNLVEVQLESYQRFLQKEVEAGKRKSEGIEALLREVFPIESSVTKKDALAVRIDQSSKIPATTFLRALDKKYSTTEMIIKEFYPVESVKVKDLQATAYAASAIIDAESGEELVKAGAQIG